MKPPTLDFLAANGVQSVEGCLQLGGSLPVDGRRSVAAVLCLGVSGAWIAAVVDRVVGRIVDASDPSLVQYEPGRLRDRLLVQGAPLSIPPGKAAMARRLLALGHLRRARLSRPGSARPADYFIAQADAPAWELAHSRVTPADSLIALIDTGAPDTCPSAFGPEVARSAYLLLTADRFEALTCSELGDATAVGLDEGTRLEIDPGTARLVSPGATLPVAPKTLGLVKEVVELAALDAPKRLYQAARRLWLLGPDAARRARVRDLLLEAQERADPLAPVALAFTMAEQEPSSALRQALLVCIRRLRSSDEPDVAIADVFEAWRFSAESGRAVVTVLSAFGAEAEPWAVALHRSVHSKLATTRNALSDLELAEHELSSGEPQRSRALVQARLAELAGEEEAIIAADQPSSREALLVRLYEVLCREAARRGAADVPSLLALARVLPWTPSRLQALAAAAAADPSHRGIAARAEHVLRCLAPGGLARAALERIEPPAPLDRREIDVVLRHPLARGSGRVATRLSELVAATPAPDLGFLRDFCEELSQESHPEAALALAGSERLLGLSPTRAYISRGARSTGLRAFVSREPFILIGKSHLMPDGPATLTASELHFAIGAEMSHLAFGHHRVTATEIWTGAAGKTRDVLSALGLVLPLVGELGGARAQKVLARLTPEAVVRAAEGALKLDEWLGLSRPAEHALGQHNEDLIAAHRTVQLSADRAGLVACKDLRAALRALLLLRNDYRPLLAESEARGFHSVLSREPSANPALVDLRVRVRALVAFYLSADYATLARLPSDR